MPLRLTRVRVSVRSLTETKDAAYKTVVKSWAHVRYQELEILSPISGDRLLRADRAAADATWRAVARHKPAVLDTDRLATLKADGTDDRVLEVVKAAGRARPTARRQE